MKISTKTIATVGMFTAVLSVLSILTIPMPTGVPVTLQTFAMALCGYVLGTKRGTASTVLYILLGTVGVPVFAGMTGGCILAGRLQRRIYLGIYFPDPVLCNRNETEERGTAHRIWHHRTCHLPSVRRHPVCHRGIHITSGIICSGIRSVYCKGCDFCSWRLSCCIAGQKSIVCKQPA